MWHKFFSKIVRFLDPRLDRFRDQSTPAQSQAKPNPKYTPATLSDFIDVLRRTPRSVLSNRDRNRIAAIMSFDDRTINDLMAPRSQMVFVKKSEVLGPLILDKLYQSGFTSFPVVDSKEKVIGILHTEALNTLEIKKTDRAGEYLDPSVSYLHTTDTLQFAVEEIERLGNYYFLVLDNSEQLVGCFTIQMLLSYLLN